jgi:Family of unknown function (DUF6152)
MKHWRMAILAVLAGFLSVSPTVSAHHGASPYDTTKLTTLKGTVTEFKFINPHVEISVAVKDGQGKVETWIGEANSPNVLSRRGWSKDIIKPGDQITVIGNRGKNGSLTLRLQKVVLPTGQELDPNSITDN